MDDFRCNQTCRGTCQGWESSPSSFLFRYFSYPSVLYFFQASFFNHFHQFHPNLCSSSLYSFDTCIYFHSLYFSIALFTLTLFILIIGTSIGLPDFVLYPFISRLHYIQHKAQNHCLLDEFFHGSFPKLHHWFKAMRHNVEVPLLEAYANNQHHG